MVRKVTFTLDDETIRRLARTAETLRKPKSEVVRDAIAEFHDRAGRLTDAERRRLLDVLDRSMPAGSRRSAADVDREIAGVRAARRTGGRKSSGHR